MCEFERARERERERARESERERSERERVRSCLRKSAKEINVCKASNKASHSNRVFAARAFSHTLFHALTLARSQWM